MAIPPAPTGYTRYLMKSAFGAGRDFRVLDPATEDQLFLIDGKIGTRPKADIQDREGTVRFQVRGNLLGIPKRMVVTDAEGTEVANLHAQAFKFIKDKIEVKLASGEEWLLEGNLVEKNYSVNDSAGRHVVQITQKWVQIRDQYIIDVADELEPEVAFALVWAVDRWVERD